MSEDGLFLAWFYPANECYNGQGRWLEMALSGRVVWQDFGWMAAILEQLRGGVIVSAQAAQGEPLNTPEHLWALGASALNGGAVGLRMAQVENLRYMRSKAPHVPLIGITKPEVIPENAQELVYITPTLEDILSIAPYCDIVAMDATLRPRSNGETLAYIVSAVRQQCPGLLLMADIALLEEGEAADSLGFDLIGTTLSGYTVESLATRKEGPDFLLLAALKHRVSAPIIMEGRIWEPADVARAFELGAHAVVIGSAVTRPQEITRRFVHAVRASV